METDYKTKQVEAESPRGKTASKSKTKQKGRARVSLPSRAIQMESQTVFENAPIGFFRSTPRGRFIFVNPALARIYGYDSPQDMIASVKNIGRQLYAEPGMRAEFTRQLAGQGFVEGFEAPRLRKDGGTLWTSTSARAVKDEKGKILYYEGFVADITKHKQTEQALRDSEEWFRRLADTTSTAIFIYQGEKFVYANRASESLSGYLREELVNLKFWDVVRSEQKDTARQRGFARQQGVGVPDRFEFNFLRKDGSERWVDFTAGLIDWQGQPAVLGTAFDVTERRQAEQSLSQLSRAVNASGDIVFLTNREGIITSINPQFTKLYGYRAEDVEGQVTPRILNSGKQAPEQYKKLWKTILRGETARSEVINKTKDGRFIPIEETVNPFLDERGEVAGFLAIQRDITARKQAELALYEMEERYRTIVEQIPAITYVDVADGKGTSLYVSPQIEKLLGVPVEEWLRSNLSVWEALIHPEDRQRVVDAYIGFGSASQTYDMEYRVISRDGRLIWFHDHASLLPEKNGQLALIHGVMQDITERKRAEETLLASETRARQLFEVAQRQARDLALLDKIRTAIAQELELDPLLRRVVESISETLGYTLISLYMRSGDELLIRHQVGYERIIEKIPITKGVTGRVARSGQAIFLPNVRIDREFLGAIEGVESEICVPLFDGGLVVGVLNVESKQGQPLMQADLELISALGEHVSVAISRARLYQSIEQELAERKRADERLQKAEARYRDLVERLPLVVYTAEVGIDGNWEYVSPKIHDLLGFTAEEWKGDAGLWYRQIHPDDREKQESIEEQALANGVPFENEYRMFRKDGTQIWVRDAGLIVPREQGTPRIVQGVLTDVTERHKMESALRESEQRYRLLVDSSPIAIALHQNGRIIFVNPAAVQLMHAQRAEDLIGQPIMDLVHPQYRAIVAERVRKTVDENQTGPILEEKFLRLDGTVVDVEATSSPLTFGGEPAVQVIVHDISERKRVDRLQGSIYEIARAALTTRSLDELYAKIQAVLQNLLPTQFFYIALYDRENDLLSFPYFQDAYDVAPSPAKPGRGLTEYVLRTRQPVLATPQVTDELVRAGEIELVGVDSIEWLGVPLIVHEQAIGVMVIQSYDESVHFDAKDMEVLTYVSTQVASAIERKRAEEALQRSEAFARSIVEAEPECVKIVEAGGILRYMNPAGLSMIEVERLETVRGKSIYQIVVPEHRQAFENLTERVLRGEHGTLQFEIVGLKGTHRWLDTQAVPLFNEQGRVDALLGITRDITERKQAEALQDAVYRITKAAENTESIRGLFPQIHQIISSVMPAENFFITLYDETHNLLEFPYFHDALDEPFLDKIEPGMGLTAYVLRTGKSLLCTQAVHEDLERRGEVKLLGVPSKIWLGVPLLVEGRAIGVMVVQHYTDPDAYGEREQQILEFVSSQIATTIQRKQSEQALREGEARYRSLVNGMLDGVYRSTHDGKFVDVNPSMLRMYGYDSREEMLRVDIRKDLYFAPEERESLFLDNGQEKVDIFRMKRRDGSEIWVEDHGRYVHDEAGNVMYHEGILRDVTERIHAEREITRLLQESQQRLRHVEALRSIDLAIGSSMDLRTTLNILLSYMKSLLAVDAADILLFNRVTQAFEFAAANGFRSRLNEAAFQSVGRGLASRVALERRVVQVRDPGEAQANREMANLWKNEGFITYTGVPLIAKGDLKGVLEIHHRSVFHPETQWMDLLQNFSTQAAIAIENAQLFNELQNANFDLSLAYDATIEGWSRALELRENEPPGRFQRVTELTLTRARAMGMRDTDLIHVRRGALLHDIGKMAIPDSILRKTGPLSEDEWKVMRLHPVHARELLTPIAYLRPALDIPCHHHEKWDGSGYPNGLKGDDIPLSARIFAIADVYHASTSDRFHRKGLSREQSLEYIRSESGKHFDPTVVGAFLHLLSKGELTL